MPRRARALKREIVPDAKYNSETIARVINRLMVCGKKSTAERVVYGALQIMEQKESKEPVSILEKAVKNAAPLLEVKPRRVGGATYQVPVEVRSDRSTALAMRWIIAYSRQRSGRAMAEKLAEELLAASKHEGASIKKREDTHKMAEANKAFAHFRW
jgi:small subunit ribosomal protein S7